MLMLKHFLAIIILSVLVILGWSFFGGEHSTIGAWLLKPYTQAMHALTDVFSSGRMGLLLRQLVAILCLPLGVSIIPAFFYWLIKRDFLFVFLPLLWASWWLQFGALLATGSLTSIYS